MTRLDRMIPWWQAAWRRCGNMLVLALGLLCLSSCSTVRVGYDNADTVVVWWLDRYLNLTPAQKPLLKRQAGKLLEWHRQTQLPQYVEFLQHVQQQLQGKVTRADLEADAERMTHLTRDLVLQALPELTDLALKLNEAQLAHLAKRFNSQNDEFRKEYVIDPQARRERRHVKRVLKRAHEWIGSFSPEQEEKIRMLAKAQPKNNQLWLDERIARQQMLLATLRQIQHDKPAREVAMESLRKLILALFEPTHEASRKAYFDAWHDSTILLIEATIKDATPAQKAFANKRLQGWIDDCNKLMARGR